MHSNAKPVSAQASRRDNSLFELLSAHRKAVMGFAALWILMFHAWVAVFGESFALLRRGESFIQRIGYLGVDVFFLYSGMGLVFSVQKGSLLDFYFRRFRRLVIPYLAGGLIAWALKRWGLRYALLSISGAGFFLRSVNVLLWFVPSIALFYLFFPLYFHFLSRAKRPEVFTAVALAVWLAVALALARVITKGYFAMINRIPVFLVGVLIGWQGRRKRGVSRRLVLPLCAPMLAAGLLLIYLTLYRGVTLLLPHPDCCAPTFLLAVSISALLSWGLERTRRLERLLGFYGGLSLELYCIQELRLANIPARLSAYMPPLAVNAVYLALLTLLSWLLARGAALLWRRLGVAN